MNYVYFIHGIGKHSDEWLDDDDIGITLKRKLNLCCNAYPSLAKNGFDVFGDLKLISIHYDDLFRNLYSSWEDQVKQLELHLQGTSISSDEIERILKHAKSYQQGELDDKFFFTHVMDLILYWGNSLVQDQVIASVLDQIFSHLKNHYNEDGDPTFSIVAHSMGTSVAHKALQRLYEDSAYENELTRDLKFRLLMQISNTSYALSANRRDHYNTLVKPSGYAGSGVCWYMVNVSNKYDLVSEALPFSPDVEEWLDAETRENMEYVSIKTSRISNKNVHSIVHYFDNPKVQWAFLESVFDKYIDQEEKDRAWREFYSRTPVGAFKSTKTQFENLINKTDKQSVSNFIDSVQQFSNLIRSL